MPGLSKCTFYFKTEKLLVRLPEDGGDNGQSLLLLSFSLFPPFLIFFSTVEFMTA